MAASAFSSAIRWSRLAWFVSAPRSNAWERIPASSQARRLLRTYTAEAGSSPTITTARPGRRRPAATPFSTLARTSRLISAATCRPSMILALMVVVSPRLEGRRLSHASIGANKENPLPPR